MTFVPDPLPDRGDRTENLPLRPILIAMASSVLLGAGSCAGFLHVSNKLDETPSSNFFAFCFVVCAGIFIAATFIFFLVTSKTKRG